MNDHDAELLAEDRSTPGWRTRAVGMPIKRALARLPTMGLLQCGIPIAPFRQIQSHIRASGMTQAQWVRRAVIEAYLRQGGEAAVGHEALAVERSDPRRMRT